MQKQRRELMYIKRGTVIEVNLHYKNYLVRANILKSGGKESNTYDVMLELSRTDIGKWDTLDEEHILLTSDNINLSVYSMIMDKFADGYFKHYIDRYEYELDCIDRGIELYEKERLNIPTER